MSNTPRTDEIIKDFVSGNGEAASIMLLRQDIEQLETELADKEKQLAGAQELIKKLRRCANCKHKVEYVRFGEVATACALDVNEEENQTCKNFDKWESEQ